MRARTAPVTQVMAHRWAGHAYPAFLYDTRKRAHQVGEALAQRADEQRGGARLEQAGHVLDRERVHAVVHQLLRQVHVVLQRVLQAGR